ncbi:TetR/AcrR family transcriptional regulator [Mesorhizobium humile]|uniref:TetR/AcrR family transcriptional regulator n=1 Tax=Mesorhizobium humile TaxID=3072313 RepID=UPI002A24204B|nr:helix-turn-helix domain-containing protein [Mesorhizobium sp. VK2D]MDX8459456.1 helix-turn-helix domain-containing protein [Mesorhizobium sp. VK2D]
MLLFWEHGYEATSLAMLREAMGLTPPQIYNAFTDKGRCSAAPWRATTTARSGLPWTRSAHRCRLKRQCGCCCSGRRSPIQGPASPAAACS